MLAERYSPIHLLHDEWLRCPGRTANARGCVWQPTKSQRAHIRGMLAAGMSVEFDGFYNGLLGRHRYQQMRLLVDGELCLLGASHAAVEAKFCGAAGEQKERG